MTEEVGTEDAQDAVLAHRDDGALTLTFNRPERRNGWADDVHLAYHARLTEAAPADLREGVASFVERRPPRFAPFVPPPD